MKNVCKNCEYWRHSLWCSNSQSPFYRKELGEDGRCDQFYLRGKKAPLALRVAVKTARLINKELRKKNGQ